MKVCMFVFGDCAPDIRVFKEARALTGAGHDVRIIGFLSEGTELYEERDGFRIFRVTLDPVHQKILRLIKLPAVIVRKLIVLLLEKPFPKAFGETMKGATSREVQEGVLVYFAKTFGDFVRKALKENPAYFLTVGWLAGTVFVILGLPSWWVYRILYRIGVRLIQRLPTTYLSYLDYYLRSLRSARRESADVYHAHDLSALPVAWLARRFNGGKVVYDSHELWLDRTRLRKRSKLNRFIVKRIESFLIRRADANIIAGESSGRELAKRYHIVPPTLILNAPSYHPVERSDILRDEIGMPREHRIILYIGRITYYRGLEELAQSLQYLDHSSLVLMGYAPPDYVAGLKRVVKDEGLIDRVHFFGPVPPEEVMRYAASADIGAAPIKNAGLSYYYCSPNKVFECIAAGLPVVGSNFPDLKKVIEGHKLGVTFDPDSPRDIARAIDYVLSDKDRYQEMRKNALEAAKIFNWENESKKLLALYEGLSAKANDFIEGIEQP